LSGLFHIQMNMSLNTMPNSVPTATILFNIALHSFRDTAARGLVNDVSV
jgi:hypothetical protein